MAKATSSKVTSNYDEADAILVSQFVSSINLEGELNAWLKMAGKMLDGKLTVKGAKATIASAEEVGTLPSIASTSAQYTLPAYEVRNLEGGESQPLKKVINTAIQGMRKLGKDLFNEKLEGAKTFAEFAKVVADAPAKTKESGSSKKENRTADEILADAVADLKELENPLFENIKDMDEALKFLAYLAKNARAVSVKHPSAQVVNA